MPKAYSKDLRKRVINYIKSGNNYSAAGERYNVSRETARKWYKRWEEFGHCNEKPRKGKKSSVKREEFEDYVNSHSGSTLLQIGNHFNISVRSAFYYMKKFGFSYKKKSPATWKQG